MEDGMGCEIHAECDRASEREDASERSPLVRALRLAVSFVALLSASSAPAQVVLDPGFSPGTVGAGEYAPGQTTDYLIRESYGRRAGDNLFHRFSRFDIPTGQSATFIEDAPGSGIRRVIAHVGGTGASQIDGVLRSTIPNADLYFYNTRGIVYGPNAQLDIMGAFHTSSASYIRFTDDARFGEDLGGAAVSVTTAEPAAWGFLSATPAEIRVQGARLETMNDRDFSITGGPIRIEGPGTSGAPNLAAPSAALTLMSLGGSGEADIPDGSAPALQVLPALGPITLANGAVLDASGTDDQILIVRAESLALDDASIIAHHTGAADHPGTAVDIAVRDTIRFGDITSGTRGSLSSLASRLSPGADVGDGGRVRIQARTFFADGAGSVVEVGATCGTSFVCSPGTEPGGRGGDLDFDVDTFRARNGAAIVVANAGRGGGGDLMIAAREVDIGTDGGSLPSGLVLSFNSGFYTSGTTPPPDQSARGGDVIIEATERVVLENRGNIESRTLSNGQGGDIRIRTHDFEMVRTDPATTDISLIESQTSRATLTDAAGGEGRAGAISIDATGDILVERGRIRSRAIVPATNAATNAGRGLTGRIDLLASNGRIALTNRAFVNSNLYTGQGAPIRLEARAIDLVGGGVIESTLNTTGRAGDIHLEADDIRITGTPTVGTPSGLFSQPIDSNDSQPNGSSGTITIEGRNLLVSDGAIIQVNGSRDGSAGSVRIGQAAPFRSVILDEASIVANNNGPGSSGGDIEIAADRIELDRGARISASNLLSGGTGTIRLEGAELTLRGGSEIAATSGSTGIGGNILVRMAEYFLGNDARLTTDSQGGNPTNEGGNIELEAAVIVLSETALRASAPAGAGGRIQIVAGRFLPAASNPTPDATGGTSAQNGIVNILTAETSTTSAIPRPAVVYEDPGRRLATGCETRTDAQGSLYILPPPTQAPPGEDLLPSNGLDERDPCGRTL